MKSFLKLFVFVAVIVVANVLCSNVYVRLDLTAEKRNTLNEETVSLLDTLGTQLVFEIYFEGDLPPAFLNLQKRLRDLLGEYENLSGGNIVVQWIDPAVGTSEDEIKKRFQSIANSGVRPFTIQERKSDGKLTQRYVFPGGFLSNGAFEVPINFLQSKAGANLEANMLASEQLLEYECSIAIKKLCEKSERMVGIISGNGFPAKPYTASALNKIAEFYKVSYIDFEQAVRDSNMKTIVIAKPARSLTEQEKYLIDCFVQSGRNVLWFVDASLVSMDSLASAPVTMALPQSNNLEDLLFKYGVRINNSLILDNQCATIPVNVAPAGEKPQFNPAPWFYAPLLSGTESHPVCLGINVVRSEFVSVLDTVGADLQLKKYPLLTSSSYSRVRPLPTPVGFDILDKIPDQRFFNRYKQLVAVAIEGVFPSLFVNRALPNGSDGSLRVSIPKPAKQIFVADGDVVLNDIRVVGRDTMPLQLGFDRYTKQAYGNAEFLLNAVNYLNGDSGILTLRSRELTLRLLDRTRIIDERKFWQLLNIGGPLLLFLVGGVVFSFYRKRAFFR